MMGIVDTHLIPTGYERTLPPGVQMTVRARRRVLAGRARGRVLDLGGADSHRSLWTTLPRVADVVRVHDTDSALDRLIQQGAKFDTVFSVFAIASAARMEPTLRRFRSLLAPDGRLLFLEPVRQVRLAGRIQSLAAKPVAVTLGWHPDRDIVGELRTAGMSVIDLEHHRLRTTHWWVRSISEGVAHHEQRPAR